MGYDSSDPGWHEEYGQGMYFENDDVDEKNEWNEYDSWDEDYNDSMDGDHDSAMTSAGWGTDEDYGYYGDDIDDYENYYGEDY